MADFHRQGRQSFTLPKTNLDFGGEETTFISVWIIFITHWWETAILKGTLSLLSCFFLHSVRWLPVNWASGIPLQDEGIRAGVTVESLGKLKVCDMLIGRKKNAWKPTSRARVLAWWRRAAKSYCAIPSICPPVMRCINISSTRLLRRMFGEDSAQKKIQRFDNNTFFRSFFCGRIFFSATWGFHWSAFLSEGLQWASSPLGFGSSGCWFYTFEVW